MNLKKLREVLKQAGNWIPYQGPRGGTGWQNVETGDIEYGDEPPGESGVDAEDYLEADTNELISALTEVVGQEPPDALQELDPEELRSQIQDKASPEEMSELMDALTTEESEGDTDNESSEESGEQEGSVAQPPQEDQTSDYSPVSQAEIEEMSGPDITENNVDDISSVDIETPVTVELEDGTTVTGVLTANTPNLNQAWIEQQSESEVVQYDEVVSVTSYEVNLEGVRDDLAQEIFQFGEESRSDVAKGLQAMEKTDLYGDTITEFKPVAASEVDRDTNFGAFRPSEFIDDQGEVLLNTEKSEDDISKEHEKGWLTTDSWEGIIIHELGHAGHYHVLAERGWGGFRLTNQEKKTLRDEVSDYAATSPLEAVAEISVLKYRGEDISEEVENIYKQLEGPNLWE